MIFLYFLQRTENSLGGLGIEPESSCFLSYC